MKILLYVYFNYTFFFIPYKMNDFDILEKKFYAKKEKEEEKWDKRTNLL